LQDFKKVGLSLLQTYTNKYQTSKDSLYPRAKRIKCSANGRVKKTRPWHIYWESAGIPINM